MFESSHIEISKSAYANNREWLLKQLNRKVILSTVVKGNAYGHGIETFVPMAEEVGAKHFSVYSCDEAVRVFECAKRETKVMVMGSVEGRDALEWAIENEVDFFVFENQRLDDTVKAAKKVGKPAKVHIEVETGMNRSGFHWSGVDHVIEQFKKHGNHLHRAGICTHFAGAENIANYVRIKNQKKRYKKFVDYFRENGVEFKYRHTNCSAAVIRYPEMNSNMVRVGILNYGLWPSMETFIDYASRKDIHENPLKRLITWKSKVMSVKNVPRGEYIGYGSTYLAQKDMTVALVPVGYAHGYSRSLSNQGRVIINGYRTTIVGLVNMNALMVDVTEVPRTRKGDTVILIGNDNGLSISISSFSELSSQLNYELLTRLPLNIPRKVVN